MEKKQILKSSNLNRIILLVYLTLATILGGVSIWSIIKIPGEIGNNFIFNLSIERFALLMVVIMITTGSIVILIRTVFNPQWFTSFTEKVTLILENQRTYGVVLVICMAGILIGSNFLVSMSGITEPVTHAYYVRLKPVVQWGLFLSVTTTIVINLLKHGISIWEVPIQDRLLRTSLITIIVLFLLWLWVDQTGYGITSVDQGAGWHVLGTPILETQVLLAWGISISIFVFGLWLSRISLQPRFRSFVKKDLIILVLIWIFAYALWMEQPLKPNWFVSEPRPPNFEFYPNSDASVYDVTAQNLLLGYGFKTRGSPFTLRPLYGAFLAGAHIIKDLNYESIISLQVAVLAFIPVLLYSITKLISNRTTGVFAATLLTLKESNAIILGDSISEAHAKLLLPFLPTALGILLFIFLMGVWLQNPIKHKSYPIILGGITGIFMLIRPEFILMLIFIGFAALLQLRKTPQIWLKGIILITAGLTMTLAPWIWRNYQLTGTIFIDSPHYRLDFISRRFREIPIGFLAPVETPEDIQIETQITTLIEDEITSSTPEISLSPTLSPTIEVNGPIQSLTSELAEDVVKFLQENPGSMKNFILNHFMNSLVQTILQLPSTFPITNSTIKVIGHNSVSQFWLDCCSLVDYERRSPFWPKWDGVLPSNSIVPVTINIILVAIGISFAWNRSKFLGLAPLFGGIGYYLINAFVRNSGGRYTVPVNWIGIFYYSLGIMYITYWGISHLRKQDLSQTKGEKFFINDGSASQPIFTLPNLGMCVGFFLFGCILPVLEKTIPAKFEEADSESKFLELVHPKDTFLTNEEKSLLLRFYDNGGAYLTGLALYPRHHKPYQMGSVWNYYHDRPYAHLDFYLSSPQDTGIILPMENPPKSFPHAMEVLVLACPQEDYFDALAVILYSKDGNPTEVIWRSRYQESVRCPLPTP